MAEGKNKIIVYKDWISTFESLSDEEAGKLVKHLFRYVNDLNPEPPDRIIAIAFEQIKQTLKRDLKKYEAICLRNRENGELGGRPKRETQNNPDNPVGFLGTQNNPNNPDEPDNDNDNDSDKDKKKYIYNAFYDLQIELADNPQYEIFVKFLFGDNDLGRPLNKLLNMTDQVGYKQFKKLLELSQVSGNKIFDTCRNLENYNKRTYKSLFLTLENWIKREKVNVR